MDEHAARSAPRAPPTEGDLLAPGLVHELRQPLTGVEAGLRLVARELGSSVTSLDGWKIATSQLAAVFELLSTYRQLLSPAPSEGAAFTVAPVVRRAVDALGFRLDARRDAFAVVVEPDVPQAFGSAQALYHAVVNLLANAIDAVEEAGGGRIEVRVRRAPGDPARAQVRVADGGTGLSAAARRRLFTPRFTTKAHGSGLGLVLSRRMLRHAGGEVRLAARDDPPRPEWARTELVVDLAASATAPAPRDPGPARLRRSILAVWIAAAALLLAAVWGGWIGFQRWVRTSDPAVPSAPAEPVAIATQVTEPIAVVEAEGRLERLRAGAWEPLAAGAKLREEDTLRTGAGARATITIGERSRIAVADATQLTVREITAAVQRLRLSRGRLRVDHQPDGARVLVVESERGDAVARAGAARFSVLANGAALAVATETGIVRLEAANETVEVGAGQQSVSFRGRAPSAPARIPVAVLLRVARAARAGDGGCTVEGSAAPGAEVRVDGHPVEPRPDGHFTVQLPTRGRAHVARVVTREASGRTVRRRVACADAEHDLSGFAVRWGQRPNERATNARR